MKKNSVINGALILTIGAVIAKVFSAIYRVVLTRILGGEGIGVYQLVFPLYSLFVVLTTAGLPMAISKVVAKNKDCKNEILKKGIKIIGAIACGLTILLVVFCVPLAKLQGVEQLKWLYLLLSPTFLVVGVSSVFKGYFQGVNNFKPTTIVNILEQFVKLAVGLTLGIMLAQINLFASIVGAIVGIVASELATFIYLLIKYLKLKEEDTRKQIISTKDMLKDILPITLTNLILPMAFFIDSVLVVNVLSIHFTKDMSIFMYGLESGAVATLINLPTIFSYAFASAILPNLAQEKLKKDGQFNLGVKLILVITIPCALAFLIVPNKIISFLYADRLCGYGALGNNLANRLLMISSFGSVFLAINQLYSSGLQAIDKRKITVRNLLIGVSLKFGIELLFLPSVMLNIYALAISNVLCYITTFTLNHLEVRQEFNLNLDFYFCTKLLFANLIYVGALIVAEVVETSMIGFAFLMLCAVMLYAFIILRCGVFKQIEIKERIND